jgi:hypothetical protein
MEKREQKPDERDEVDELEELDGEVLPSRENMTVISTRWFDPTLPPPVIEPSAPVDESG